MQPSRKGDKEIESGRVNTSQAISPLLTESQENQENFNTLNGNQVFPKKSQKPALKVRQPSSSKGMSTTQTVRGSQGSIFKVPSHKVMKNSEKIKTQML